ncbi:MAG: hypothetical protein NTV42_04110 [Chloroflexi bacterium]|nr:hypothetical protein [Chloroflexota bacterium]
MRKEYLACEEVAAIGGVRITPIVRILVGYTEIKGVRTFYAGKQPVYLIISSGDGERAYSVTGREVSIQQVISDCPALAAGLEA